MSKIQYSYKVVASILDPATEKAYQQRIPLSEVINEGLKKYIAGQLNITPERKRAETKAGLSSGRLDKDVVARAKKKAARHEYSLNAVIEAVLEKYIQ